VRFVFSVANEFEYNKEGKENHVEHGEYEHGENEDKSLTDG
jgi:hypothetical protein